MVMPAHASASTKSPPPSKPKGKKAKPFRSLVGRTPHIKLSGDIITSPFTPEKTATTIAAGKFKATCLQLLDAAEKGESITITKRGKVVARLVPPEPEKPLAHVPLFGIAKGKIKILGDIVSPDFEAWGMPDPRKKK